MAPVGGEAGGVKSERVSIVGVLGRPDLAMASEPLRALRRMASR